MCFYMMQRIYHDSEISRKLQTQIHMTKQMATGAVAVGSLSQGHRGTLSLVSLRDLLHYGPDYERCVKDIYNLICTILLRNCNAAP